MKSNFDEWMKEHVNELDWEMSNQMAIYIIKHQYRANPYTVPVLVDGYNRIYEYFEPIVNSKLFLALDDTYES